MELLTRRELADIMMNRSVLIITAALLVAFAARAGDLKIQSFDQQGRLTFHQVPATDYRVEWTTNLLSPVWNSNAPGLAHIPGGASMSVYYEAHSPPLGAWQHRVVPLSETGWKVSGTTTPATQEQFKSILSQLVGLYLYTEWRTGPDDTTVDNIIMAQP